MLQNDKSHINKVIHYCWFGGKPLPKLAQKCIASWKKYLPDYEIKRWDESNFDVKMVPYTKEAYELGKYAFVSDYARFWILYNFGGLYFDTDVEVIKPIDEILKKGPFMGCQNEVSTQGRLEDLEVNAGLGIAAFPKMPIYKKILDYYASLSYKCDIKETVVWHVSAILRSEGLKYTDQIQNVYGVDIYPKEYFCPIDYKTNKKVFTNNTCLVHHFSGSWFRKRDKVFLFIVQHFSSKTGDVLMSLSSSLKNFVKKVR